MRKSVMLPIMSSVISFGMAACGGGEDMTPTTLAKQVSNIQCEPARTTLQQLDNELTNAGVQAYAKRCGWDGILSPAVCGAQTTYLHVVEAPKYQENLIKALGYRPTTDFYMFLPSECPTQ